MDGMFVPGGCCILDFYHLWMWQAIYDEKDPDRAEHYARLLVHSVNSLLWPQRRLFNDEEIAK